MERARKAQRQYKENLVQKGDARKKAKVIGYCTKCNVKRPMGNPHEVIVKNGRKAVEGTCRQCGNRIIRMGKMPGATEEAAAPAEPEKKAHTLSPPDPVAAPVKVEEKGEEVIMDLPARADSLASTDPYDDPVLYHALQERVRAGIAKGARTWVKKDDRFYIRFPGGATHSLGDKESNLPSPPTTSAKAFQAIREVFAEHAAAIATHATMVPLEPSPMDAEQIAGEPAKSLRQQPFIAAQVAQAVWINTAYNKIGRVAVSVATSTKLLGREDMVAALREDSPESYIALVSNALGVMAQNVGDPDFIVRLRAEVYDERVYIGRLKLALKDGQKALETIAGDRDLAISLLSPSERLQFFKVRAKRAILSSPAPVSGNGHAEGDVPTVEEGGS